MKGALGSIDAIGSQTQIAAKIRREGGDYLLTLKANQPTPFEEMRSFMLDAVARGEVHVAWARSFDKEHERFEERTCWVSSKIDWFADRRKWSGLSCIAMAAEALEAVRAHWGVKTLHWVLDVVWTRTIRVPARGTRRRTWPSCGGRR